REFGFRDEFARDCLLQRRVTCEPDFRGEFRHQGNASSGGQITDIEIGAFLSGPPHPEQEALLRVIGASIVDPQGTAVEDEQPAVNAEREWSEAELTQLGNMLVRGLSIEE